MSTYTFTTTLVVDHEHPLAIDELAHACGAQIEWVQQLVTVGILVVPNAFRDSVAQILETQWDSIQHSDLSIGLVEPNDTRVQHLLRQLPGVITVEPARGVEERINRNLRLMAHAEQQLVVFPILVGQHHHFALVDEQVANQA